MTAPRSASSTTGARCKYFAWAASVCSGVPAEQIPAMELDGEIGIFEQMAGQDQDDGLAGFDESAPAQLLESGQRDGGGGFATDAIGADFGFGRGDFDLP